MPLAVTEPHPSVPSTSYLHSGRGGAGNYKHVDPRLVTPPTTATGPASRTDLSQQPPRNFTSGRGGIGNVHQGSERAIFSFDEELARQKAGNAPVFHVGRGGMGNFVDERRESRDTDRMGSVSSGASSVVSGESGVAGKARRSVEWIRGSMSRVR